MRTVLAIGIAFFLASVMGCGKYVLKSEVEENYLPKAEVKENYIPKAEVEENYVPKTALQEAFKGLEFQSTDRVGAVPKTAAEEHTCRYWFTHSLYVDLCLLACPPPPDWQDLGVPCPQ
ncbi:hypothetical protein [Desulfosarcina ovata]|uniref:Lipoprotein n=1 Tax=Desulfosarcina ovata subsp. ovata TaxID=2752305 RepID=A0A5K8AMZ9_9BACT|nr:hypothetical protein [Desulfosarcina ovata]BBO92994.1 hypothetical protein DSCOOX_61740 [Desulfosarcina ovata subsp. ovata]